VREGYDGGMGPIAHEPPTVRERLGGGVLVVTVNDEEDTGGER